MKVRKLNILLALWWVFLILPALLVEFGVFGRFDIRTDIRGSLAGLWVVGYLAQFGIFLWIMNVVSKQKIVWWFVASLLPWAIDWSWPVSPWFGWLCILAAIATAVWIALANQREESLQQQGIHATGTVLEVLKPWMNVIINRVYIKRKLRLRIEREDSAPAYEGVLNGLFMLGEIPSPGDRIPLVVDPQRPQRFEYAKDGDSPRSAPAHAAAASTDRRGNIADELEKLTDLRDRGALTDSEFIAAKKRLLRS